MKISMPMTRKQFVSGSIIASLATAVTFVGCALLGEPVADKVAGAIDRYCDEPQNARALFREMINAELALEGHSIIVTCNGDVVDVD